MLKAKKLVSLLMAGVLAASVLTACGGSTAGSTASG